VDGSRFFGGEDNKDTFRDGSGHGVSCSQWKWWLINWLTNKKCGSTKDNGDFTKNTRHTTKNTLAFNPENMVVFTKKTCGLTKKMEEY
jgi:hypothetical protein